MAWADEILAGTQVNASTIGSQQLNFPIPIFRRYKGTNYPAQLLKGWRIQLNGKVYPTPLAAAVHISGNFENGWRVWRYLDEATNKEQPIDVLRNS